MSFLLLGLSGCPSQKATAPPIALLTGVPAPIPSACGPEERIPGASTACTCGNPLRQRESWDEIVVVTGLDDALEQALAEDNAGLRLTTEYAKALWLKWKQQGEGNGNQHLLK